MRTHGYLLIEPSSRTVDGIQENIVKRGKRNVICQLYHAKNDKKAIAAWELELNMILHVFNVCSGISVWALLMVRFQTELGMATRAIGSDARQDAANEHTVVSDAQWNITSVETIGSDVQGHVSNTHTTASGIHHTKLKSGGGADGQDRAVSTTRTLSPSKYLPLPRLTLGQRSRLQLNPILTFTFSAPGESSPPVLGSIHGITPNIRRDAVSEVHRGVVRTQTMVSDIHDMLRSQQGAGGQPQSVSATGTLPAAEHTLTVA